MSVINSSVRAETSTRYAIAKCSPDPVRGRRDVQEEDATKGPIRNVSVALSDHISPFYINGHAQLQQSFVPGVAQRNCPLHGKRWV
jgi:hypothetical protein